jgi:hypothetical protein
MRFETMALDETRFTNEDDLRRWHRILGRILALVPENALELEPTRALRRLLDAEGLLTDNEPIYRCSTHWGGQGDIVRDELRRAGVDMDAGPNRQVLDASNALYALVQRTPSNSAAHDLAVLWRDAMGLLALIDANRGLHNQLDRSAWGHVANAVERVASTPSYAPGAHGLPDLTTMFEVLERLSSSPYPEPRESET